MNNILVSFIISLSVSLITFIVGFKTGKNQIDRKELKRKYQDIYVHLEDIKEAIKTTKPKKWSDYEKVQKENIISYMPLLRKMNINGDGLELDKKLFKNGLDLEQECMKYSCHYYSYFHNIYNICLNIMKNNYNNIHESDYEICSIKEEKEVRILVYTLSLGTSLSDKEFNDCISKIIKEEDNYYISFRTKKRKKLNIYKNSLNLSPIEFLKECKREVEKTNEIDITKLDDKRRNLLIQLNKINNRFKKRVKEPYTFLETLCGAFIDVFRF